MVVSGNVFRNELYKLAKKYYFYGVHGKEHKWMVSYLEYRSVFSVKKL